MCTVIITVPEDDSQPVRLLAIRDEDPQRPWDRLGPWWPGDYPGVLGIRDARAGGAWLAADPDRRRLSVLLNRHDLSDRPDSEVRTRGTIALESAAGRPPAEHPQTRGFNLVEVTAHTARVVSWNGVDRATVELAPGTHMVAHDDVDDLETARIAHWLPEFRAAADTPADDAKWWQPWMEIVERSAELPGTHESAIIRRQSYEDVPSYSLLVCVATVGEGGLEVRDAPLETPGEWTPHPLG
ncbi:MAG: NRDE family protein [Microbacterium sp.]